MIGFINLYMYDTGRLHAGTGVYPSKEIAKSKVSKGEKKRRYVETVEILIQVASVIPVEGTDGFYRSGRGKLDI